MTDKEAIKLAIATLDEVRNEAFRLVRNGQMFYAEEKVWNTIAALKERLAQEKALQALHNENERLGLYKDAYAEQEPVAWIDAEKRTFEWNGPVLWTTPTVAVLNKIPLYTTPPRRTWVGLTDDEIALINADYPHPQGFARAIEAKLKEKNT